MIDHTTRSARLLALACVLAATLLPAAAGDLVMGWQPSNDQLTAGYDVELLDDAGTLLQILDVGPQTQVELNGLNDGTWYRVQVRPYDTWGQRAREASRPVRTLPAPRVETVSGAPDNRGRAVLALDGANFADGAIALSSREDARVLATTVVRHDHALAEVQLDPGAAPLAPGELTIVNPVRRTPRFIEDHPQLLDVDRSGALDGADLEAVRGLFGVSERDARYEPALDVNGDGVIDGEDASLIELGLSGRSLVEEPAGQADPGRSRRLRADP